jgi:hypothetical protein
VRLAVALHTEDVPASRCPPWISTCCYKVSYVAVGVLVWSIADAASPRFQPLRNAIQWKPVMARRASVEHSCGWRRIWISHRKRSVAKRPNRRPRIALSIGAGSMKGRMQSNDSRALASSSHAIDDNSQILPQTPQKGKKVRIAPTVTRMTQSGTWLVAPSCDAIALGYSIVPTKGDTTSLQDLNRWLC